MKLVSLLSLSILFASLAHAETKVLLLDGGGSEESNFYEFYDTTRKGYEVSKALGLSPVVYAADGTWRLSQRLDESLSNYSLTPEGRQNQYPGGKLAVRPTYPPIRGPLRSLARLRTAIARLQLKPKDHLIVMMTGHGEEDIINPGTGYDLFEDFANWKEIAPLFKEISPEVTIQIHSGACFGGGLHYLARKLPNVCTASATQFFELAHGQEHTLEHTVWDYYRDHRKTATFGRAAIEGFKLDSANPNQGSLSSFDYMAVTLKKPPYDAIKYKDIDYETWMKLGRPDSDPRYRPLIGFSPRDLEKIKSVDPAQVAADGEKLYRSIPTLAPLPEDFLALLRELSGAEDPTLREYLTRRGLAVKTEIDRQYATRLTKVKYGQDKFVSIANALKEFAAKATPAQKAKLQKILQCEWTPFL